MIKRISALFISILYYFIINARCCLYSSLKIPIKDRHTILCYHQVTPKNKNRFIGQVNTLFKYSTVVGLNSPILAGNGKTFVSITFDDAYKCLIDNAFSELIKRKIPFAIFVPTGLCENGGKWRNGKFEDAVMSCDDLSKLPADLVTIGSHTVSHGNLCKIDNDKVYEELNASKLYLENKLGRNIEYFAFPYGYYKLHHIAILKKCGYTKAYGAERISYETGIYDDCLFGRVVTSPDDWKIEYYLKIKGAYNWRRILGGIAGMRH